MEHVCIIACVRYKKPRLSPLFWNWLHLHPLFRPLSSNINKPLYLPHKEKKDLNVGKKVAILVALADSGSNRGGGGGGANFKEYKKSGRLY